MSTAAGRPAVTPTNTADGRRAAPAEDERQAQVEDQQSDEEAEGALADSQFCRNCVYVCLGCQTELMLPKDAPANCQKLRCHECKLVHDAPEYHERRKQRRTGRGASEDVVPSRAKRRRTGDPRADCASDSPERDDYEVEAITCRRVRDDGQLEFYVRWVGYGRADDSWEPVEHLLPGASELVQEYERRREQYMESDLESDDEWEDRPHDDAKALDNETPREFAKRLGVDEEELIQLNKAKYKHLLQNAKLQAGTVLLLPDGRPTQQVRPDRHFPLPQSFPHTKQTNRCGTGVGDPGHPETATVRQKVLGRLGGRPRRTKLRAHLGAEEQHPTECSSRVPPTRVWSPA